MWKCLLTSGWHEAGLASLAFCKQTALPLLAELCSGCFVWNQALFWSHWPVVMFPWPPACLEELAPARTLSHTQLLFSGQLCLSPYVGKCANRSESSNPGGCCTAPSRHIPAVGLMRDTPVLAAFPSPRVLQLGRSFSFLGGV